jgi:hypothetical protein
VRVQYQNETEEMHIFAARLKDSRWAAVTIDVRRAGRAPGARAGGSRRRLRRHPLVAVFDRGEDRGAQVGRDGVVTEWAHSSHIALTKRRNGQHASSECGAKTVTARVVLARG